MRSPNTTPPHTRGSRQKHTQVKPLEFIHTATDTPSEKHWWKDHETGLTRLIHAYKTPLHKHKGLFQSLIQGKRIEHDHMRFENKRGQLRFFFQPFSCYRCHCHGTPLHTDTGPCAQIVDYWLQTSTHLWRHYYGHTTTPRYWMSRWKISARSSVRHICLFGHLTKQQKLMEVDSCRHEWWFLS